MKKYLLNIAFVVSLAQAGLAQTAPDLSWRRFLNSSEKGMINSIDTLSNGNYVLAGVKYNDDPNNKDMLIAVTDRHSQKIWSKVIAGEKNDFLTSVKVDNDGNLIAVGYTWSVEEDVFGTSKGNGDCVAIKLDAEDGSIIWAKRFGGSNTEYFYDVQITSDGNYLIAGSYGSPNGDFTSYVGGQDAFILKLDTDGNKVWLKTFGIGGNDYAYKVQETSDGGFVFFGENKTSAKMPNSQGSSIDIWVVKVDEDGNEEFNVAIGGSLDDFLNYGIATSDGGYIIAGHSKSNDGDFTNVSEEDGWIVKLKSNGTIDWKKSFASGTNMVDKCKVVLEAKDNGFVVFTTHEQKYTIYANLSITKFTSTGTESWTKTYLSGSNPYAYHITDGIFTADGGYLAVGGTTPDQLNTFYGTYTASLVKLGGTDNPAITSIWPSKTVTKSLSVYPNPAISEMSIELEEAAEIRILNLMGEVVSSYNAVKGLNTFNVSSLTPGMYQVMVGYDKSASLVITR